MLSVVASRAAVVQTLVLIAMHIIVLQNITRLNIASIITCTLCPIRIPAALKWFAMVAIIINLRLLRVSSAQVLRVVGVQCPAPNVQQEGTTPLIMTIATKTQNAI